VIDLSLNEVETLSAKAARGAGFSWGLAEDIGRAARRIAVEDENWGEAMLSLAENAQSFEPPDPARTTRWRNGEADVATGRPLCPIRTAALLVDDPLPAGAQPMPLLTPQADIIIESRAGVVPPIMSRRGAIDERTLAALNSFAARTYVPESERSRIRGAGGGRVDDE